MKKALSSIIATLIILVLVVVAIGGFQNWFLDFESGLKTDIEKNYDGSEIKIEGSYGSELFIYSNKNQIIRSFKILDSSSNEMCSFEGKIDDNFQSKSSLVFTFDADEVNSTHVFDISGKGNNGSITNAVFSTSENCLSEGCFYFDGSGDYIRVFDDPSLDFGSNSFSYSAWFTADDSVTQTIFSKGGDWTNGPNLNSAFSLGYRGDQSRIYSHIADGSTRGDSYLSRDVESSFVNVIVVIDRESNNRYIYYNGVLNNTISISSINSVNNAISLFIGTLTGSSHFHSGYMDELVIYNVSLSSNEASSLYDAQKALLYEQILSNEVKKIDISSCNLQNGQIYSALIITDSKVIDESFIKK